MTKEFLSGELDGSIFDINTLIYDEKFILQTIRCVSGREEHSIPRKVDVVLPREPSDYVKILHSPGDSIYYIKHLRSLEQEVNNNSRLLEIRESRTAQKIN